MAVLIILVWLVCGFLGAYITFRSNTFDMSLSSLISYTSWGGICLISAVVDSLKNIIIFKHKEIK